MCAVFLCAAERFGYRQAGGKNRQDSNNECGTLNDMGIRGINWVRAIGGAVLAEAAQIAAAFGWVAIYSYLINPGQPMAVYQAHAEDSGPWVAIFAGFVIFYCVSRWIARSLPTALALFSVFVVVDVLLLVLAAAEVSIAFVAIATGSYLTKLLACYLGGRRSAAAPV